MGPTVCIYTYIYIYVHITELIEETGRPQG